MYSITTLIENIDAGNITVELNGHKIRGGAAGVIDRLKNKLNWYIEYYNEILGPNSKERDEKSIEYAKKSLDDLYKDTAFLVGDMTYPAQSDENCSTCGENLNTYLLSPTVLSLGKYLGSMSDMTVTPIKCMFTDGVPVKVNTISVPTGKLLFANYFTEFNDCTDEDQYTTPWSINSERGRHNVADYLANQNVGYIQTGNMSVYVYKHKTNDELVLLDNECDSLIDDLNYYKKQLGTDPTNEKAIQRISELEEAFKVYAEYDYVGSISCGVWRVMFADQQFLDAVDFKEADIDYVPVDVPAGEYEITNYHDSDAKSPYMMRIRRLPQ